MDLDRLRVLVAAVESGSLATAARHLRLSQSTVRRRISELQMQVGVPLLVGSKHSLKWTAAAELIAIRGRGLLEQSDDLLARMQSGDEDLVGEYRVGMPCGMHPEVAGVVFQSTLARFPRLRLKVLYAPDPMVLLPEEVDLVFRVGTPPTEGPWLTAVVQRLRERVLASRDYLAQHPPIENPAQIEEHPLLSWIPPASDPERWPLRNGGALSVRCRLVSHDIEMLRRCMLRGMGLARLPDADLPEVVSAAGQAVSVLPEHFDRELIGSVVMPDTEKMSRFFRSLSRSLRDEYGGVRR